MDPQLKQLLKELGGAINESLAESELISEAVSRIKKSGYDISLTLEATVSIRGTTDKASVVTVTP